MKNDRVAEIDVVQSFTDVTITDAGINTLKFVEAATGLVGLFGTSSTLLVYWT